MIVKGDEYIKKMRTQILLNSSDVMSPTFSHISYSEKINNEEDMTLMRYIDCEEFTLNEMIKMFKSLINRNIHLDTEKMLSKKTRYIIGDLRIENPKVSSRDGFIELPIRVIEEE